MKSTFIDSIYQRQRDTLRGKGYDPPFTGVKHFANRLQPFTVWRGGTVLGFCETENEAVILLARSRRFG